VRPRVILFNAVSLDGRIDHVPADPALYYGIASRWQAGAILAGSETILRSGIGQDTEGEPPAVAPVAGDDPRPLLVVPDSRGRIRSWNRLRSFPYWRDLLALCSRSTPREYLDYLAGRGVETAILGEERVDLGAALTLLHDRFGIRRIRVDSGGTLNGVLLRQGLVDEVHLLVHPCLVGGTSPKTAFRAGDLESGEGVIPLRLTHLERLGDDIVWMGYEVVR
jgi:2,5-diamino-6-(ribosylamino)-4(3H)-pyrimidinone 5'-phosphate reductase